MVSLLLHTFVLGNAQTTTAREYHTGHDSHDIHASVGETSTGVKESPHRPGFLARSEVQAHDPGFGPPVKRTAARYRLTV